MSAFRTLGVHGGGAAAGAVIAADVEAHPYLRAEEGKWFERNLGASVAAVARLEQEQAAGPLDPWRPHAEQAATLQP